MPNRGIAPITVDGAIIGYITSGNASDVSPDPLGGGNALGGPAPSPAAFPHMASREYPGRDAGTGQHAPQSRGASPHAAPYRTLGGTHAGEHHSRHLDPANRERTADTDKPNT
jgi:hypothetical protein